MRRLDFEDGETGAALAVAGERLVPHPLGALYWPDEDLLLVADLHLEKAATFARGRQFLPPYDTRATLDRLAAALAWARPRRVIALGDSFHTSRAAADLDAENRARLAALQRGRDWLWILGNHDRLPPCDIGGETADEIGLRGISLRHEPGGSPLEIAGHLHPAARIAGRATLRARCFATDGLRLVMPAFGALAGGLNVLDPAFAPLLPRRSLSVWMCGRSDVYRVSAARLLPDGR
jgi:DNA ligase-associated metallophosphoesterase